MSLKPADNTSIELNNDFSQRVVIRPSEYRWVDSPVAGVKRMMLDRVGGEIARATTIVQYKPNSHFTSHLHKGGEEILVLDGLFSDEHNVYPPGSYVRNPIGTSHTPKTGEEGATVFVKLHQFSENDTAYKNINTNRTQWFQGLVDGLQVMPLHEHGTEHVALVKWAPNTQFTAHKHWSGEEILVLSGTFYDEHGEYPAGTWIRSPHLSAHTPFTKKEGALIYVKTGHL